ncbi:hypothetical protein [Klebsiella michiganensis]|uniref:hypothetical protein n=1 Tax=Klebsiella michiganensis TaxID=1134687 RepID=UPI001D18FD92|nr:hypothetical protein [Klebsiella michiganensis]
MKVSLKVQSRILPLCLLAMTIQIAGPAAAAVRLITVSQAQDAAKMTPPRSEHITSGSGEKQTHTAELRTSLQKEDRLLRAEEQGIIDQGARTAIHIREQEVQRDIR